MNLCRIYNDWFLSLETLIKHYGVPLYFFRASLTSAVEELPICCVQWIPFVLDEDSKTTTIGRIRFTDWQTWPVNSNMNKFISFSELQPSRYALSFIPPTNMLFVEVAFISIDSENLGENSDAMYYHDFGDNMFPYFQGNSNLKLFDDFDEDKELAHEDQNDNSNSLKSYIPPSIIEFLTKPIKIG